jgi:hypothetical protein
VRTHQREDLLIGGRELPEPGTDRHPRRAGHYERGHKLPQPAHPHPLYGPSTIPSSHTTGPPGKVTHSMDEL